MWMPDVNVLVAAQRSDHEHHALCRRWLTAAALGRERLLISEGTLVSVMRVVTHRAIFDPPTSNAAAIEYITQVRAAPRALRVVEGDLFFSLFRELCILTGATGRSVPDAAQAALAIEHGGVLVTLDGGFGRFPRLMWMDPRDGVTRRNPERKQ